MSTPVSIQAAALSMLIVGGEESISGFLKVFISEITNPNTREAYARAVADFLRWCHQRGMNDPREIRPTHIGDWLEELGRSLSVPMIKQRLTAVRCLFELMVTGGLMTANPAQAVRGPSQSMATRKSTAPAFEDAWRLLDAIPSDTISGKRDRALIGLIVYSLARIGALLIMEVQDVYAREGRLWVRLREKGDQYYDSPCQEPLAAYLEDYLGATGLKDHPQSLLFRTIGRGTGQLTEAPLPRECVYMMIQRRTRSAGIVTASGNPSFRATGIAARLKNGDS
jgi:site-specific recombinase XerC